MIKIYVFGYEYKDKEFVPPKVDRKIFLPPVIKEKWKGSEENKLFSIIIYNDGKEERNADIIIDFSPSIIKGWKIYDFVKIRIKEGGMINERKVSLQINKIEPKEKLRIDFLIKNAFFKIIKCILQREKNREDFYVWS